MVLNLGEIKTQTKVSVLPWYKDNVKGNILFIGTRAPNWPGAGSHGCREAACGLGVEGSCRWSCKKSPSHKVPSCCVWAGVALGSPRESQGGSCAFFWVLCFLLGVSGHFKEIHHHGTS